MMKEPASVDDLLKLGEALTAPPEHPTGIIFQAQELLKVRDRYGGERPLIANRAQQEFERARGQRNIVLKARQMGMTTWVSGRFFLKTVTARGVLTVQVAQTREAAESIFRIVQRFWECLPKKYREGPLRKSRSNVRQMIFPHLDSEFRILSAADHGVGRGLTIQNLHCSEVSRWPGDARETLAGLRAALSPRGELVLESTANGAYGCFYNEWTEASERGVAKHFLPWWYEEAYVAEPVADFTDEEQELIVRHDLSAAQIGYRRKLTLDYDVLRAQEFAESSESCFRATGDCCFEIEAIDRRLPEVTEPIASDRGTLWTWKPSIAGRTYLIGVDPAGGGSEGDYSAAQVIDLESGIQCAELRTRISTREFAERVVKLGREYNNALLVVERNNHGHGVIACIQHLEYPNLYEEDGAPGWNTTASSKARAIVLFGSLLHKESALFESRRLLGECRTFITRPNGSTGAVSGAHDDCLMAMAIVQSVRNRRGYGKGHRPG